MFVFGSSHICHPRLLIRHPSVQYSQPERELVTVETRNAYDTHSDGVVGRQYAAETYISTFARAPSRTRTCKHPHIRLIPTFARGFAQVPTLISQPQTLIAAHSSHSTIMKKQKPP
ncbi:hypothetical protein NM688_g5481 [Phlebia brevispora]|uniref:Uncharacterized protein n=1 Tax=Phlebia brevispora TaxID=194682 RepID=A0ACC1SUV6_9APHY|nr:hypothetical protein NM688_g5481 [Phlebia brevispora]